MTESIKPLWDLMLTFFQFLKSSGYMCNLCCQNDTFFETLPNNPHLENKHFRTIMLIIFFYWLTGTVLKLSNHNLTLALLIGLNNKPDPFNLRPFPSCIKAAQFRKPHMYALRTYFFYIAINDPKRQCITCYFNFKQIFLLQTKIV